VGRHVLAIDLGTSALKVALVSTAGEVVASEQAAQEVTLLPGGGAEQDPRQWWDLITAASSRLMARGAAPAESVVAVACTAQWSGTVAVDSSGQPVHDAIIWMDSRGAPYVRAVTGGAVQVQGYGVDKLARWLRTTAGIPAHSGKDPLAHILWLKHSEPEAYRRAHLFLEPKDWLNAQLTGRAAATFDSISLHWVTDNRDPGRIRYDPALLRLAGIEQSQLPELLAATDILGPLLPGPASALGVPAGIPVVAGTPDVQSAAIGSGATRDYQAHLYVGTSSWLTCHVPFKKTDLLHNMASLPSPIPHRYFVANEQETAGAALTFLRDRVLFGGDPPASAYAEFDKMAGQSPPGSHGVIFTPWLYGERTPVEDRFVRGGFHNLSLSAGRDDLVRAVFEGVALNTRWLLRAVERFTNHRLEPIRFIGGGARSEVLCQIFADVLGRTIEQVSDPVNANARGVAMLAAVALGELTFDQIPDRVQVARRYPPDPTLAALYGKLFSEFTGLYRRNRKAHARLNHEHSA
jgi:xylulokinase